MLTVYGNRIKPRINHSDSVAMKFEFTGKFSLINIIICLGNILFYTTLTDFTTKYLAMCKVFTGEGGTE